MLQTPQSGSERRHVEVHEKAGGAAGQLQIGDDLRKMDAMEPIDRFQFDNDTAFDQEVQLQLGPDSKALVGHGNSLFCRHQQVTIIEFQRQALSVHRLQQAPAQRTVHFNRATNDPRSVH